MYYTYPWYQWLMFFYIYCFFGWIFESTYVSLKKRRFVNRGFLRLPLLPLYGTGAVMMLWVSLPFKDNVFLVYISGVIAATILEYVTGYVMERLFKMKYWDYSNQKFQYRGYICLSSSIAWGFLTIFLTEIIHTPIANFVLRINPMAEAFFLLILTYIFVVDAIQSTKAALDLGRALEAMTKLRAELEEAQLQMALLKGETRAFVEDFREDAAQKLQDFRLDAAQLVGEMKDDAAQRIEDFKDDTVQRIEDFKDDTVQRIEDFREDAAQKIGNLRMEAAQRMDLDIDPEALSKRMDALRERQKALLSHMNFYGRGLLKGNPTASSKRFADALKEFKEHVESKINE